MRAIEFFRSSLRQRDWFALGLQATVLLVGLAAVSILGSQTMRQAALKRFHLASDHYGLFAMHQLVPSMYNFKNEFESNHGIRADGQIDSEAPTYRHAILNHFPSRIVTFGDQRGPQFLENDALQLQLRSSFLGTTLTTRWDVERAENGVLKVERRGSEFSP